RPSHGSASALSCLDIPERPTSTCLSGRIVARSVPKPGRGDTLQHTRSTGTTGPRPGATDGGSPGPSGSRGTPNHDAFGDRGTETHFLAPRARTRPFATR